MKTEQLKTLIFDLDGVITSENKYWNTARLTVWELITSENYLGITQYFGKSDDISHLLDRLGEIIIPNSFIYQLKSRAVNSNWDLTFFVICLHLTALFTELKKVKTVSLFDILKSNNLALSVKLHELGKLLQGETYDVNMSNHIIEQFWQETSSMKGAAVLEYVNYFLNQKLGIDFPFFDSRGDLWQLCYENFQAWYEGKKNYHLPDDETVLDLNSIDTTLSTLYHSGHYTLAIATGRPRNEVIQPLSDLGLLQYFDPQRIVTYDEVLEAELILSNFDKNLKLGKPHPFVVFKAIYPDEAVQKLCAEDFRLKNGQEIAYIGDAGSDVVAAKKAGCISIGVLTGFAGDQAREMLVDLNCDVILDSILELPQLLGVPSN